MVMANNKKEQPSKKATSLNRDKEFVSMLPGNCSVCCCWQLIAVDIFTTQN